MTFGAECMRRMPATSHGGDAKLLHQKRVRNVTCYPVLYFPVERCLFNQRETHFHLSMVIGCLYPENVRLPPVDMV